MTQGVDKKKLLAEKYIMVEVDDNTCFFIKVSVWMIWVNLKGWNYFSSIWSFSVENEIVKIIFVF